MISPFSFQHQQIACLLPLCTQPSLLRFDTIVPTRYKHISIGQAKALACAWWGRRKRVRYPLSCTPYVRRRSETSQKAPPCPAASCGACPGTTHGTSCRFRSVSEGCISSGGAACPTGRRNSRHHGRTRQPAATKTRLTHLKDDTVTADDAKDARGTRTKTATSAKIRSSTK